MTTATKQEQSEWAKQLRDLAEIIETMAQALTEDDEILGALAGQGLVCHLPALPQHIREVFLEYLSDEAAAAYKADLRYFEWEAARG